MIASVSPPPEIAFLSPTADSHAVVASSIAAQLAPLARPPLGATTIGELEGGLEALQRQCRGGVDPSEPKETSMWFERWQADEKIMPKQEQY